MASRTNQAIDRVTLLHTGQSTVNCAGFSDPAGAPWLVMNDTAAAVQGLEVTNAAANGTVTLSVAGANADTNPAIKLVGRGTGATVLGSSVSAVTLAGAPTVSSNFTVTGVMNASTITSCTAVITSNLSASTVAASSAFSANTGASSSQFAVIQFGLGSSSTYQRPGIYVGSSFPSVLGPAPGSLFFFEGGTSSNAIMVALPNGGTGSSSNWAQFGAFSSAQ